MFVITENIIKRPVYSILCYQNQLRTQEFFSGGFTPGILSGAGGSTNSVEDRGRENGDLGAVSSLVRGSAQFANE
jgi:hypothetical protein